jgi:hypothetical protein
VSQEFLNVSNVGSVFQQVGGERVPQAVNRGGFFDFCFFEGVFKYMLGGTYG